MKFDWHFSKEESHDGQLGCFPYFDQKNVPLQLDDRKTTWNIFDRLARSLPGGQQKKLFEEVIKVLNISAPFAI